MAFELKNPEKEASGNQLYHLNKAGLLSLRSKAGSPLTMGEVSPMLGKILADKAS